MPGDNVTANNFPYVVNICYSLGHWLKDYGYYPKDLPLFTYMDHGMTLFDKIPEHEINNDAPLIFKFSPRLVDIYRKQSKKPVYNLLNPAIHYRLMHAIRVSDNAKGSLFFVGHSTPLIDDLTDWNIFIEDIKKLPDIYYPIDICLHPADLEKGLGKIFQNKGYKVLCADNASSNSFIENFYKILKQYKYTLSNLIGSYTFYSVEMGIPFSLYGEEPKYFNKGDPNVEIGNYASYKDQPTYKKAIALFSSLHTIVNIEQESFVNLELGKNTTISRLKTSYLLYKAYLIYSLRHTHNFKHLKNLLVTKIFKRYRNRKNKYRSFIYKKFKSYIYYNKNKNKLLLKKNEYHRLTKYSQHQKKLQTAIFNNNEISFTSPFWFLHSVDEIFVQEVYKFISPVKEPVIIDCGANIGLSVIYFKELYKGAHITAFEADPSVFSQLQKNISRYSYDNIRLVNKAVWKEDTMLTFFSEGSVGGMIDLNHSHSNSQVEVATVRLQNYLHNSIDLLKMDIEGAEYEVLKDCHELLINVKNLFIEYHVLPNEEQTLHEILGWINKAGFKYYIREAWNNMTYPLMKEFNDYYQMQLNIFCYR